MNRHQWITLALAGSISAGFAAWVAMSATGRAAFAAAADADARLALACLGLCAATPALRAMRLGAVLPSTGALARREIFAISAQHTAASALLPARLGEGVLVWLLKRSGTADLGAGVAVLLVLRLMDLLIILSLAALGGVPLAAYLAGTLPVGLLAAIVFAAFGIAALGIAVTLCSQPARRFLRRRAGEVATVLRSLDRRGCIMVVASSLSLWSVLWLAAAAALGATDALGPQGSTQSAGALAAGSLAFASPVNGLASAGPFEAAFAGAATGGGGSIEAGVGAALILHACALAAALGGAAVAIATRRRAPTAPPPRPPRRPGTPAPRPHRTVHG